MTTLPDPGSFRDPSSRVYVDDDHVWRGLSETGLEDFEAFAATDTFRDGVAQGRLVATDLAEAGEHPLGPSWAAVVRHERVPLITYPYEWSFSMLRDAALLQLDLSRRALAESVLTKDASPYNVQFVGSRPLFIDIGSFEALRPGEPWPGYRQFCELFLNPLYVQALAGVPFQPMLRSSLGGIPPSVASAILRGRKRFSKHVLTHVRLHARAEARYANADATRDVRTELRSAGFGPKVIAAQLANLTKAVEALSWQLADSTWSDYSKRGHYTDADLAAKTDLVSRAAATARPRRVLDVGANDGHFSRVAIDAGAGTAVAVDSDHLVVDHLYRALRAEGDERIIPLVLDLADPSPGTGWRGRERAAFIERVRPDLVLCLAVVHHLALTNTVPFEEIVGWLHDMGSPLVVEFPHRDDPMVQRLLGRKRDGLFDHYDLPRWEEALSARFDIAERTTLPSGLRTVYRCLPR